MKISTTSNGNDSAAAPGTYKPFTVTMPPVKMPSPFHDQVGGDHYKDMAIQPIEYILANGLGYGEGAVIKYVSRWRKKGGIEDLKKARHFLDLLIAHETKGA